MTGYFGVSATVAADSGDGGLFNVTGSTVSCKASSSLSEAVTLGASKEHEASAISADCLSIIRKGPVGPGVVTGEQLRRLQSRARSVRLSLRLATFT